MRASWSPREPIKSIKSPCFKDLIFKEFTPDHFEESVKIMQPQETNSLFPYTATEDIFGDGSILLSSHDGHAKGRGVAYSFQSINCLSELISAGGLTFSP